MTKHILLSSVFLLCCTAMVFANDEDSEDSAIRVYDANETLVYETTSKKDVDSFIRLLKESIEEALHSVAFTQIPEKANVLY